jgi:radical SAM superfamily enzyme YgiQ (UPF0313 family)
MTQSQKRILLIEPPFYRLYKNEHQYGRYPLSLGYIAGTIKKNTGWNVMVYNADFYPRSGMLKLNYLAGAGFNNYLLNLNDLTADIWQEIKASIREYQPAVVGITTKSQNYIATCNIAKIIKEIDRKIIVIIGGPHPSMVGKDVLSCPDIDIGVQGEGEATIVELLHTIEADKSLETVAGICYRRGSETIRNPQRRLINNLDSLCFPHQNVAEILKDYELYPKEHFKYIFAVRGCPYGCLFCGSRNIWSRKVRSRSPENIVTEIQGLQKMGIHTVRFDDDTFGVDKRHIKNLCDAIRRECPGLRWDTELHVRLCDDETISLMKEAGCYSIQIGFESGNNEILKAMTKNTTVEASLQACKIIKKYGIKLQTFFMVGFPQETEETLKDTVEAMRKTKCDVLIYSIFTPYPGTEMFEYCRKHGLVDDNFNVSLFNHQSPANCFSRFIKPERFRELVSDIEIMVDKMNLKQRRFNIFSKNTIMRVKELGLINSLRKSVGYLTSK